jgi:tetratricopeptide (TPR) repeat protein
MKMSENKKTYRSFFVSGIVILVISILLLRIPLFNYLGYEFSAAIALIIPVVNWILAVRIFQPKVFAIQMMTISKYRQNVTSVIVQSSGILLLPYLVATANVLFVKNCSYGEGMLFYILIPLITSVWSAVTASFCLVAVRRSLLLYGLILFIVLAYPLYIGYISPQIYSYNFIYGYFAGFSYDETLYLTPTFILSRVGTLLVAVAIVVLTELILCSRNALETQSFRKFLSMNVAKIIPLVIIGSIMCTLWLFRYSLGFESSGEHIAQVLGREYTTQHFRIIYSGGDFSDEEMNIVAATHEFRFHQVTAALQISYRGKITSFIYPDAEMKRRFIGTGNTNIAKPWRKEIHLNKDSWEGTLKHELVHVIAGEAGMPVIKAHYNIGLTEGLATAIDNEFGNRTLHEYAAAMLKFKLIADPVRLIKPVGFAFQASSVSYVMMGSFCRFLIDRYGILRLKELYGGGNVEKIYGMPYEKLIDEWQHYLERVEVPESWRQHIEYFFRRPSIFAKECAHAVANENEEGYRLLERNTPVAATEKFRSALVMSWNTESYGGLVRSFFASARYDSVVELMNVQMRDTLRRSGVANLYLLYGDALWYRNDALAARDCYREILSLDLSERYNEAAAVRLTALGIKELRATLAEYIVGSISDSAAEKLLRELKLTTNAPIVDYLTAKLYLRQEKFNKAINILESLTVTMDSLVLDARKHELLGESYFMLKKYQQARICFWKSLNYISNKASVERINDWVERCEWFEMNKEKFSRRDALGKQ